MATGDGMLTAVMIILSVNLVLFFVGNALSDIGGTNPFNVSDNALNEFNEGDGVTTWDVPSDPANSLPGGGATSVSPDTGLSFTDIFTSIKEWLIESTGLGWVLSILSGPKVVLSWIFPSYPAIVWALTSLWYGITLFMIVAFIWGR